MHTLVIASTLLALSGCAGTRPYRIDLMPAPDVYADGMLDPFRDSSAIPEDGLPRVFFATDRLPAPDASKPPYYLETRGYQLRFGVADVSLSHEGVTWDVARRVSLLKNRTDNYPLQVTSVHEFGILDRSISLLDPPEIQQLESIAPAGDFCEAVNNKVIGAGGGNVYIYVHGYRVNFENPILVAAELWHFLGYDGAVVAFAWPSHPRLFAYAQDTEVAAVSARHLRLLIEYLSRETQAARIHILGYSSGTRVVVAALAQMALMNAHKTEAEIHKQYRLGNVILVGSDVDRGLFGAHVRDGLLKVADRFSIYLSESDRALRISNLFFGHDRLGRIMQSELAKPEINQFLNAIPNLSVIDVSNAEKSSTGNGHAYFRDSPWVSSDILSTLLYDLSPEQRGLVRTAEQPVWRFPPDYIHRLSTTLANINPALRGLMEK